MEVPIHSQIGNKTRETASLEVKDHFLIDLTREIKL